MSNEVYFFALLAIIALFISKKQIKNAFLYGIRVYSDNWQWKKTITKEVVGSFISIFFLCFLVFLTGEKLSDKITNLIKSNFWNGNNAKIPSENKLAPLSGSSTDEEQKKDTKNTVDTNNYNFFTVDDAIKSFSQRNINWIAAQFLEDFDYSDKKIDRKHAFAMIVGNFRKSVISVYCIKDGNNVTTYVKIGIITEILPTISQMYYRVPTQKQDKLDEFKIVFYSGIIEDQYPGLFNNSTANTWTIKSNQKLHIDIKTKKEFNLYRNEKLIDTFSTINARNVIDKTEKFNGCT